MFKGKISGFLTALILAVLSFFIIFLFFPEVSNQYFNVSLRDGVDVEKFVDETTEKVTEKVKEATTEVVSSAISSGVSSVSDRLSK
ncbi:MAG: hypothetical protein HUK24_00140 [Sphaerochaetaceae bacterium]|nr:hypothetical protein [Sphaerochaetaceae bacterium]